MSEKLTRWAYTVLWIVLLPLVTCYLLFKNRGQNPDSDHPIKNRFGFFNPQHKNSDYLFHCVSVGEVVSASSVIKALKKQNPELTFTVTTTTPTGAARVGSLFASDVQHCYLPFDIPFFMGALLNHYQPQKVVITEVELWPNFIHVCWKRHIPVCVLNARLTDKSAASYAKLSRLFIPMLHKLSHVCAQGERDARNYAQLGIAQEKLTLTHNIKFDQAGALLDLDESTFLNIQRQDRLVLVGGSTHDGEESALIEILQQAHDAANLLLILVPRHPQRFDTVARLLEQSGLCWCRSSSAQSLEEDVKVLLVDEMGKLNQVYAIADIAFVGGSLTDRGGHNALEPAAFALPITMGPHIYNNPMICEVLQQSGALTIVQDKQALTTQVNKLLASCEIRQQTGKAGKQILIENQGAVAKTLTVLDMLKPTT